MKAWTQLSWTNEHNVLKRTFATLLNEAQGFYLSQSQNNDEDFQATCKDFERRRDVDLKATRKGLQSFRNDLKVIRSKQLPGIATAAAGGDTSAVTAIKDLLESFEAKLSAYKSAMRKDFDALQAEYGRCEEDLHASLESTALLATATDGKQGAEQQHKEALETRRAQQEHLDQNLQMQHRVARIDRQIQELGGRCGRWDPRDHDIFMRIWNQTPVSQSGGRTHAHHPKKAALCKKLSALVVDKTDVDCEEHFDWFLRYTRLLEEKKALLEEWKGVAQSEKTRAIHAVLSGRRGAGGAMADAEVDTSGASSSHDGPGTSRSRRRHSESEAQSMRERIERWRQQKAEEAQERLKVSRDDEARDRARQEDLKKQRQQEARLQIDKWKTEEAVAKQLLGAAEQRGSPAKRPLEVEANHSRDMEMALRRREEREAKEKKAKARELRLKEMEGKLAPAEARDVKRDTQRLQGATLSFGMARKTAEYLDDAERRRQGAGAHSGPMALNARDLSSMRRATPAWIRHAGV